MRNAVLLHTAFDLLHCNLAQAFCYCTLNVKSTSEKTLIEDKQNQTVCIYAEI